MRNMFAKRLKEYREKKAKTLAELSAITEIPAQTLSRYELGQRVPNIETFLAISDALGVNPMWLIGRSERA